MNPIQRRLFRAFVEAGGDLMNDRDVELFVRHVEITLSMLPSKVRAAIDATWRAGDPVSYTRLAASLSRSEGGDVSPVAFRQRVSRGLRVMEVAVRKRRWAPSDRRMSEG